MIVFPLRSCTAASLGMETAPDFPAATIWLPSMTMTEFSMGARPVPSIRRAPLSTIGLGFVCALAGRQITRLISKALRKAPIATRQAGLEVFIVGLLIIRGY